MKMLLRRALAGGTVLLVVGLTGPVGAAARETAVTLTTHMSDVTLAPDTPAALLLLQGSLARSAAATQVRRVAYRVDYSAVAAFATLVSTGGVEDVIVVAGASRDPGAPPCTGSGPVLTCTTVLEPRAQVVLMDILQVRPTAAARAGDTGKVVVTARVDGGPPTTSESRVRIGEGVDLASSGTTRLPVRPGGTAAYQPTVRNAGTKTVDGVVLHLPVKTALLADTSYTNCTYGDAVVCTFDTALAAGVTYRTAEPISLRAPADAATGSRSRGDPQWLTPAAWEDWRLSFSGLKLGRPGTRTALSLVPLAASAGQPQVDEDEANQEATFDLAVTGADRPDLAAVGARVTGAPGARIPVRVGFRNRGPGTLYPLLFDNNWIMVTVDLPGGLTVDRADPHCLASGGGDDRSSYQCWMRPDPLRAGASALFAFTLAVTGDFDGDEGRVEVITEPSLDNGRGATDNTAVLRVTTPGSLPITGPGLGAAAGVLLALGGAGLLLIRRRRPG